MSANIEYTLASKQASDSGYPEARGLWPDGLWYREQTRACLGGTESRRTIGYATEGALCAAEQDGTLRWEPWS